MQSIDLIPGSRVSNIIGIVEDTQYQFNYLNLFMEQYIKDLADKADKTIDKELIKIPARQYMYLSRLVRSIPINTNRYYYHCKLLRQLYSEVQVMRGEVKDHALIYIEHVRKMRRDVYRIN